MAGHKGEGEREVDACTHMCLEILPSTPLDMDPQDHCQPSNEHSLFFEFPLNYFFYLTIQQHCLPKQNSASITRTATAQTKHLQQQ